MKCSLLIALFCMLFSHVHGQDKPTILIGSGGGVTGMANVYRITPSGEVFRGKGIGDIKYTECAKIKRAKAKKMIAKVATVVSGANFDHPGNMYYFMTLQENDGEKKVTWGDTNNAVPDNIKTLYEEIQAAITGLRYKPITDAN